MARKKPGPTKPLEAYARLGYLCARCDIVFVSPTGPEIFCDDCRAVLNARSLQVSRKEGGSDGA